MVNQARRRLPFTSKNPRHQCITFLAFPPHIYLFHTTELSSKMLLASLVGPSTTPGSLILDSQSQPYASTSALPIPTSSTSTPSQSSRGRTVSGDGDELLWSGRRLTWSRGTQLYRQYTYDREEEDVAFALFVHFPSGSKTTSSNKGKEVDVGQSDTFGPFQTSNGAIWGNPSTTSKATSSKTPKAGGRTLIVFLQSMAHVYLPSGEDLTLQLPYGVEKAWALPEGGVMVQRVLDRSEQRRLRGSKSVLEGLNRQAGGGGGGAKGRRKSVMDELGDIELDDDSPKHPRLSVLMGPLEEFRGVVEGSIQPEGDGWRLGYSDNIDSDRSVLFSAEDDYPPIVVLHNRKSGQIIFTRRVNVPIDSTPTEPYSAAITPRTMRPSELFAMTSNPIAPTDVAPPNTGNVGRARPSLRREPSDRQKAGLADPLDRAQRRAPRVSRALETYAGSGELQRTLDPASGMPSTISKGRNKSRIASGVSIGEDKRRESGGGGSVMREDMSIMAGKAKHVVDEWDMRETTMLMGLEREEVVRSEVVLDWIWAWSPPE